MYFNQKVNILSVGTNNSIGERKMFDRLQKAVDEKGEVMIRTDSGEDHELHKHNTEFLSSGLIKVDADDRIHWLNPEKVERYWIHEDF
ncbi:MAG: hypothetical protein ACI8Z7_000694 [Candidatus Nanohaloarchaea archaeon]|jgi:hypothetical protein